MKTIKVGLLAVALSAGVAAAGFAWAGEDSYTATSNTAISITGDINLNDDGITFANGTTLEFAGLVGDHFVVYGESVPASVYRVRDPADPELENGNRLCGSGNVTYVATWGADEDVSVAVFTGDQPPASSDEMCASYSYSR